MKKLLTYLILLIVVAGCTSNEDNSTTIVQLNNWTDSVLTNSLNTNMIFDSILEKGNERKRIWKSNSEREEYLLIDDMDTLVRTIELKDSKIRIINEYCVDGKNPKSFSKILLNGQSHGRERTNYCDLDSVIIKYYNNNILIEK